MSQYALKSSSERIEPNPEAYLTYTKYFQVYKPLYEPVKGDFKTLTGLVAEP
jgi:sugar (pentulose or hexulose) kinase